MNFSFRYISVVPPTDKYCNQLTHINDVPVPIELFLPSVKLAPIIYYATSLILGPAVLIRQSRRPR
jgi:hypothetical protein